MRGDRARLFVALDPPDEVAEELTAWARGLIRGQRAHRGNALRLLDATSLHLTLCFIGERPLTEIESLAETVTELAQEGSACELALGAPVWLPARRPRALAVEAHEPSGELARLAHALQAGLLGAWPSSRRFRAHITLARLRAGSRPPADSELPPTPAARFTAEEIVLYRSWLEPQGARYEPLAHAPLGDSP